MHKPWICAPGLPPLKNSRNPAGNELHQVTRQSEKPAPIRPIASATNSTFSFMIQRMFASWLLLVSQSTPADATVRPRSANDQPSQATSRPTLSYSKYTTRAVSKKRWPTISRPERFLFPIWKCAPSSRLIHERHAGKFLVSSDIHCLLHGEMDASCQAGDKTWASCLSYGRGARGVNCLYYQLTVANG